MVMVEIIIMILKRVVYVDIYHDLANLCKIRFNYQTELCYTVMQFMRPNSSKTFFLGGGAFLAVIVSRQETWAGEKAMQKSFPSELNQRHCIYCI